MKLLNSNLENKISFIINFQVKAELDDSRNELKRVREAKKEEKKRLADEDAQRRIRQLEETCSTLQKQVWNSKYLVNNSVCRFKSQP